MTHAGLQRRSRRHKVVAKEWPRDQCFHATFRRSPVCVFHHVPRRGEIHDFTGLDDACEPPLDPEPSLDTAPHSAEDDARRALDHFVKQGLVRA